MSGSVIAFFVIVFLVIGFFIWLYDTSLVAFIVVWSLIGAAVVFAIVYALCKHFIGAARDRKEGRSRQSAHSAKPSDEDIAQFVTPVTPPEPSETLKPLVYRMPAAPEPEESGLQVASKVPAIQSAAGEQDLKPVAYAAPVAAAPVPHSSYPYTYTEDALEDSEDWVDDTCFSPEEEDDMDMDEDDDLDDLDLDEDEDEDWEDDLDEDEEDSEEDEDYDDILDDDEDDILQDEYVREKRKKDLQDYYYYYDPDLKIL